METEEAESFLENSMDEEERFTRKMKIYEQMADSQLDQIISAMLSYSNTPNETRDEDDIVFDQDFDQEGVIRKAHFSK